MFSRLFGKRDKSADSPSKAAKDARGPGVPERVDAAKWGIAERAVAPDPRLPQTDKAGDALTHKPAASSVKPTPRSTAPVRAPFVAAPRVAPTLPDSSFPADHQIDFELPTAPQPLVTELTLEQRKNLALATVEQHHQRVANTIRTLWGYRECSVYINRLIMAGGDGMGHARVGFNQDAVAAMLALSDVHDAEFGPPSTLSGTLGLSI
jgi:hypothetical protein